MGMFGCNKKGMGIEIFQNSVMISPDFENEENCKNIKVVEKTENGKPVLWTVDGKMDPRSYSTKLNSLYADATSHFSAVFSFGKSKHRVEEVTGTTCFDLFMEYEDENQEEQEEALEEVIIAKNVCLGGKKDEQIFLPYLNNYVNGVSKLKFNWVSGDITCNA